MTSRRIHFRVPRPYHLGRTLSVLAMGRHDPTLRVESSVAQAGFGTPDGPVGIEAVQRSSELTVQCHGPGTEWIEPLLPGLFGLNDEPDSFQPADAKMRKLVARLRGLRLPRAPIVFQRLMQIVLLQLVSWNDAFRAWRRLTTRYGTDAPGPLGTLVPGRRLRVAPSPATFRQLAYHDLVECGVLPRQARLILLLARRADRIEGLAARGPTELAVYLKSIPGIGDWTVQYLLGSGLGQQDAVLTGDFNMPHTVSWFLKGEPRGSDARMLELLEPYRGHRFRVISLLWQSGIRAPRRGPRMPSNRGRF